MGLCSDHWSLWWCKALSRSRSFAITLNNYLITILVVLATINFTNANSLPGQQDAIHITAILGESVIFNCHVEFPGDHPVPYVLQWEKKVSETGQEIPIYIWYENYPTHSGEGYEGRVSRVSADSPFGAASLNLTNIRESDQGWYECKVVFLNRSPNQHKNGSWFHLDVHAPPRFSVTPEDIVYVNLGDSIILNCQAEGTPTPEILWYKDANPVDPSSTVGIFNDGTELRISTIRHEDIGDYTCIARNGEGQVSHTARVIIAGGAVIMVPPTNQTKLEGEKAIFTCEAKAMPGNVTVRWFREGSPVREVVASLETRVTIRKDGSLIINPVNSDDSGQYLCEVSNGIGDPQSASAYLNVEYPAKVTFTPSVQYLPFRLAGVVQCYIKSNPPLQYVTWTKDKRLLEPYQTKDIVIMNNGSLLFTRVNQNHQGRYTCTPYNAQGTQGSSGAMEVLVRKPPIFTVEPDLLYQRKVGESVEMNCDAQEAEGTQRPNIQWLRRDGMPLQRNRVKSTGGNITIENLRRSDFGFYQCVVSNEVATIVSGTQLVIEGTQPHAPYNVSGIATENSITITWMPGYSGGPDYKQEYTLWYREAGVSDWATIQVSPPGSTSVTINGLSAAKTYEFQVVGKNALGDGMMSQLITVRTLETTKPNKLKAPTATTAPNDHAFKEMPEEADSNNSNFIDSVNLFDSTQIPNRAQGPKPGQLRNVTVTEVNNGFLISWQEPLERTSLVQHYTIKYRTDAAWETLNRGQIRSVDSQYLVKNLVGGRTYYFRVLAHSQNSYESSDEVKFPVPALVKHKAITAGVVGGILFFIVAIILSICAVKICNQRKRRKQEKAYNMVACRITDARNSHCRTGSASSSHVPLNKYRGSRIPGLKTLAAILRWAWPADRCANCQSIYSITRPSDMITKKIDQIHRSTDGRFVITYGSDIEISRPTSATGSNSSESDDGGFLPRRTSKMRTSWRRPLVSYPSEISFAPVTPTLRRASHDGLLRIGNEQQLLQIVPVELHPIPPTYQNIDSLDRNPLRHTLPYQHTPSRVSRIVSSSPAVSSPLVHSTTIMSPQTMYFSDLSSVLQASSRDRSLATPNNANISQLRLLQERYAQELPSLRAIHEETQRMAQHPHGQLPQTPSQYLPNSYYQPHLHPNYGQQPLVHQRPKSRLLPRHVRMARSAPELGLPPVKFIDTTMEASPESQSSSSGFGSRNTSHAHHNHSLRSASSMQPNVRNLPPYRPPPQPLYYYYPYDASSTSQHSSPYTMEHWVDLIKHMSGDSYLTNENQASDAKVDVGSVDGHYEFDPATPTPTASTPTGATRDDLLLSTRELVLPNAQFTLLQTQSLQPYQRKRVSKYENMEARVQAMKEEFYAYRKRQAVHLQMQQHSATAKNNSVELESAC